MASSAASSSAASSATSAAASSAASVQHAAVRGAVLSDPSTWSIGWTAVLVPNAAMVYMHGRGGTLVIVNTVLRTAGVYGLFAVPFIGLAMEKSFYDTALALQGIDPCVRADERKHEGFPSLPSLSLVPVRKYTFSDLWAGASR
uniref:Uncharacterized protein n=1 Tax=Diacronema lutheri TaxID=2081491 RepID=A0A7R9UNA3_DIALT|mmetsp:Transcript_17122/g.53229  ORF Transcript_17122/g.53229 Transcript_17122/m.53229 type:complete len:144 (+) Transcript_17122:103-534(+)